MLGFSELERLKSPRVPLRKFNVGCSISFVRIDGKIEKNFHRQLALARKTIVLEYELWKKSYYFPGPFVVVVNHLQKDTTDYPYRYLSYYEPWNHDPPAADFICILDVEGIEVIMGKEEEIFQMFLDRVYAVVERG